MFVKNLAYIISEEARDLLIQDFSMNHLYDFLYTSKDFVHMNNQNQSREL